MASLTVWNDNTTGVEARWNKAGAWSVSAPLAAPRHYRDRDAAIRAAKRLAAKLKREQQQ